MSCENATTISHDLAVVNHVDIPLGVGYLLQWDFYLRAENGELTPQDLTGRAAQIRLTTQLGNDRTLDAITDGKSVRWAENHLKSGELTPYVLLIEDAPGTGKLVARLRGHMRGGTRASG